MIDNAVWFVGKDVAQALDYSNSRDALIKHVPNKFKKSSRQIRKHGVNMETGEVQVSES